MHLIVLQRISVYLHDSWMFAVNPSAASHHDIPTRNTLGTLFLPPRANYRANFIALEYMAVLERI